MSFVWRCERGLLRYPLRGWYLASKSNWPTIPQPLDMPRAEFAGPNSDSVLLIGDGPAMGFGVASHNLALPGHLARQISRLTCRGTIVECITDRGLTVNNIERRYGQRRPNSYAAVIVLIGVSDAVRLTDCGVWRSHLRSFIRLVNQNSEGVVQVILVAIPPLETIPLLAGWPVRFAQRHALALNQTLREIANDQSGVSFLPFTPPPEPDPQRYRSAQTYRAWAALLSPKVAAMLDVRLTGDRKQTAR